MPDTEIQEGRRRVVIEAVTPQLDGGRFPIKRTVGETVAVEADAFTDGHDVIACRVLYREDGATAWQAAAMDARVNDHWLGQFTVTRQGGYRYTVCAWIDHFQTWRHDLVKREQAEDIAIALQVGAELIAAAAHRADGEDAAQLVHFRDALRGHGSAEERRGIALDAELAALMDRHAERRYVSTYEKELAVVVDRKAARFSAWYEFFPRSCVDAPHKYGDLERAGARLDYVAEMGFDVVYLPPIHPIGLTNRKGRNNSLSPGAEDPGSPWAIGSEAGGHKAIHPQLGTLEDFRRFVAHARELGLEVALDVAFQTSPDHPYVAEHPQWFRWRPDGTVQYAENPPKKYQDIYPLNFETEDWRGLWEELKSVFEFWIEQGVTIFRVDNPHTKPFGFWEWLIGAVKARHPEVLFLAEAFARPKIMHRLAKLGFTQSYTYFTWRNTKWELEHYFTELTRTAVREYFRPNLWPNTPDILNEYLQFGGRPAFMVRAVLAATLGASYGVYGPAFELLEHTPREPGSEEYLDSEKYQVRQWELARPDSLKDFLGRLNRIRRENPALQGDWHLQFHHIDNEQMVCYSKHTENLADIILVVANLDAFHTQSGWVELPLREMGLAAEHPYQVHDLLSDARYLWQGARNFVQLDPRRAPAQIFRLRRRVRSERDFEYFF